MPPLAVALLGLVLGAVIGFAVRRARLCTFGAIEDAMEAGDFRRLRAFGLALAVAILGTQGLVLAGAIDPAATSSLPAAMPLLSIALGAVLFGLGMSLVGTCAFGCLVRLGGGDLRALVTLIIFSGAAFATLRGVLAPLRVDIIEKAAVPMPMGLGSGAAEIAEGLTGAPLRAALALAAAAVLLAFVFRDPRLKRSPRLLAAGAVLGLGVPAGFLLTGVLLDEFDRGRLQSLTFVSPVARGVLALFLGTMEWRDAITLAAAGVAAGAFLAARAADEFRWDAFDDHHEMKRHMAGGLLMGVGGILAGGCTIGQGLTAGSLLALSWPVAVLGFFIGARLGIAILVEGSVRFAFSAWWSSLRAAASRRR
jgi:hypothetical protein